MVIQVTVGLLSVPSLHGPAKVAQATAGKSMGFFWHATSFPGGGIIFRLLKYIANPRPKVAQASRTVCLPHGGPRPPGESQIYYGGPRPPGIGVVDARPSTEYQPLVRVVDIGSSCGAQYCISMASHYIYIVICAFPINIVFPSIW